MLKRKGLGLGIYALLSMCAFGSAMVPETVRPGGGISLELWVRYLSASSPGWEVVGCEVIGKNYVALLRSEGSGRDLMFCDLPIDPSWVSEQGRLIDEFVPFDAENGQRVDFPIDILPGSPTYFSTVVQTTSQGMTYKWLNGLAFRVENITDRLRLDFPKTKSHWMVDLGEGAGLEDQEIGRRSKIMAIGVFLGLVLGVWWVLMWLRKSKKKSGGG